MSAFSEALSLPLVPFAEWVERLAKSAHDFGEGREAEMAKSNPALRLLSFFRSGVSAQSAEAFGAIRMDTSQAVIAAESFKEERLPQLSADGARSWLNYWRTTNFM